MPFGAGVSTAGVSTGIEEEEGGGREGALLIAAAGFPFGTATAAERVAALADVIAPGTGFCGCKIFGAGAVCVAAEGGGSVAVVVGGAREITGEGFVGCGVGVGGETVVGGVGVVA